MLKCILSLKICYKKVNIIKKKIYNPLRLSQKGGNGKDKVNFEEY